MRKSTIVALGILIALVGGVVGGAAYVASRSSSAPTKVGAGDIVQQYPSFWVNGINIGVRFQNIVGLNLTDKKNQAVWLNNTGRTVMVGNFKGILVPNGKGSPILASSTLILDVATSTTATVTDKAAPIAYSTLIDTYSIATSTTNNIVINSTGNKGTNGQGTIAVAPNQYLIEVLENPYNQACTGVTCETATSTNRGYNISASAEVNYANQ